MRFHREFSIGLLALIILPSCHQSARSSPIHRSKVVPVDPRKRVAEDEPVRKALLAAPVGEMAKVVTSEHVLPPDARFVIGAGAILDIFDVTHRHETTASLANGEWVVQSEGRDIGHLPLIPSFTDASEMLRTLAATSKAQHPLAAGQNLSVVEMTRLRTETEDILSSGSYKALETCDTFWKRGFRSGEVLAVSTRALLLLTLQDLDALDMADQIRGRAIGFLAAREAVEGKRFQEDEALLAHVLGYSKEALELSERFPADSPVRSFIRAERDHQRLIAERAAAPPLAKYLYLLGEEDRLTHEQSNDWVERHFGSQGQPDLPLLKTQIASKNWSEDPEAATEIVITGSTKFLTQCQAA